MQFKRLSCAMLALTSVLSACGIHPPIPSPTRQTPEIREFSGALALYAPPQKAWQWTAQTWFTAELNASCKGIIRYVDPAQGIDSYVGEGSVPDIQFSSDDPDVIFAMTAGATQKLIFSTDGGRTFVREVRELPDRVWIKFVVLRKGQVYVGVQQLGYDADGYFPWTGPGVNDKTRTHDGPVEEFKLTLLVAPLDKQNARIGWYQVLAPTNYQFRHGADEADGESLKRLNSLDGLGLPRGMQTSPLTECMKTASLPPTWDQMKKAAITRPQEWYDAAKAAHPGWSRPENDAFIERMRSVKAGTFK